MVKKTQKRKPKSKTGYDPKANARVKKMIEAETKKLDDKIKKLSRSNFSKPRKSSKPKSLDSITDSKKRKLVEDIMKMKVTKNTKMRLIRMISKDLGI